MSEENLQSGTQEMFVRRGHYARAPEFADGLRERSDHLPQKALVPEGDDGFLEHFLKETSVEFLHRHQTGIMKHLGGRMPRFDAGRWSGVATSLWQPEI